MSENRLSSTGPMSSPDQDSGRAASETAPPSMLDASRGAIGQGMLQRKIARRRQQRNATDGATDGVTDGATTDGATEEPVQARDPAATFAAAASTGAGEVPYRQDMERSFGQDFSGVQATLGRPAEMLSLGAQAVTQGERIVFSTTNPSREVVAHELAHVVQNRQAKGGGGQGGDAASAVSHPTNDSEREAETVAARAAAGESVQVQAAPSSGLHFLEESEVRDLLAKEDSEVRAFLSEKIFAMRERFKDFTASDVLALFSSWKESFKPEGSSNSTIQEQGHEKRRVPREKRQVRFDLPTLSLSTPSSDGNEAIQGLTTDYQRDRDFFDHQGADDNFPELIKGNGKTYVQGWKVHVCVAPDQIAQLVAVCLPLLHDKLEVYHKVVQTVEAYRAMTLKKSEAGKFITIYPRDLESLVRIVTTLDSALLDCTTVFHGHERSPYDLPVGSSGMITARYGAFTESTPDVLNPTTGKEVKDNRTQPLPDGMKAPLELVNLCEQARLGLQRDRLQLEQSKLEIEGPTSSTTRPNSNSDSNSRGRREKKLPSSSAMSLSMPDHPIGDRISIVDIDLMLGQSGTVLIQCLPDKKEYLFDVFGLVFTNEATLGDANELTKLLMEREHELPQGCVGKVSVLLFNRFRLLGEQARSSGSSKQEGGKHQDRDRDEKRRHRRHKKDDDEGEKKSRSHGARSSSSKKESSRGLGGTSGPHHGSTHQVEQEDKPRVPLTKEEQSQQGFALLPILAKWHEHDKSNAGSLKQFDEKKRHGCTFHLRGGKLVSLDSGEHLDTTKSNMGMADAHLAISDLAAAEGLDIDTLDNTQFGELQAQALELGGTQIFVMNAQGEIFAAKEMAGVIHHSTFLAGGAIACAGTIRTSNDGTITFISNKSGHYEPGPAYLWQVLSNMRKHGVDLGGMKIWVLGLNGQFPSAEHFFRSFDPSQDPRYFNSEWALAELEKKLAGKK